MKIQVRIFGLCPERGGKYRIEIFKEPQIQKMKATKTGTKKQELAGKSPHSNVVSEVIEIQRKEVVYMFPDGDESDMKQYLRGYLPTKIEGALGDIRNYFDSKKAVAEGGTLGLKKPFEMGWNVAVNSIEKIGKVIPIGFTKRFTYKGGRGGMGTQHYDIIDEIDLTLSIMNPALAQTTPEIFNQAIQYLEAVRFAAGRHATLKILKPLG